MRNGNRIFAIRCKDCFWFDACQIGDEQGPDTGKCTQFKYTELHIKKPNFWLYLAGDLTLSAACVLFAWLGLKYDNAGAFFIVGAFSVMASDVFYEYQQRLRDYWRYLREVQKDV